MVHALKNIAIRLWIAVVLGGLATLGLLAILGSPLDVAFNLTVAVLLTTAAFLGCGWTFNRIAALRLQDCFLEATSWERTARIGEAAEAFRKAIILFDSFMVSPLFRHRMGGDLAGRIARFHIARAGRYREAEAFVTSYLWAHPDDGEVTEYWLQHTRLGEGADPDHLALADRIAAAQPDNTTVQSLIAQIYIARHRTDYVALQTYKRLLQGSNHIQSLTVIRLADLFVKENRADEWALEVYLKASDQAPDRTEYLRGLAACLEQIKETERNESLITAARKALHTVDEVTLQQWRLSFPQATAPSYEPKQALTIKILKFSLALISRGLHGITCAAGKTASIVSDWVKGAGKSWRESARTRHIAKWTAVIAFAAIVIISAISTIIYIQETKESPEVTSAPAKVPTPEPSGRYTVQAASFRNKIQAVNFSERIKQLGYPAYWGESRSSEEDVWYYVRISRFEERQEAKEFGEELKSKGIIEDFYVANYKTP